MHSNNPMVGNNVCYTIIFKCKSIHELFYATKTQNYYSINNKEDGNETKWNMYIAIRMIKNK